MSYHHQPDLYYGEPVRLLGAFGAMFGAASSAVFYRAGARSRNEEVQEARKEAEQHRERALVAQDRVLEVELDALDSVAAAVDSERVAQRIAEEERARAAGRIAVLQNEVVGSNAARSDAEANAAEQALRADTAVETAREFGHEIARQQERAVVAEQALVVEARENEKLQEALANARVAMDRMRADLIRMGEASVEEQEALQKLYDKLKSDYDRLEAEVERLKAVESELAQAKAELAELELKQAPVIMVAPVKKSIEAKSDAVQQVWDIATDFANKLRERTAEVEQLQEELYTASVSLKVAREETDQSKAALATAEAKAANLEQLTQQQQAQLAQMQSEIANLRNVDTALTAANMDASAVRAELKQKEAVAAELKARVDGLLAEKEAWQQSKARLLKAAKIDEENLRAETEARVLEYTLSEKAAREELDKYQREKEAEIQKVRAEAQTAEEAALLTIADYQKRYQEEEVNVIAAEAKLREVAENAALVHAELEAKNLEIRVKEKQMAELQAKIREDKSERVEFDSLLAEESARYERSIKKLQEEVRQARGNAQGLQIRLATAQKGQQEMVAESEKWRTQAQKAARDLEEAKRDSERRRGEVQRNAEKQIININNGYGEKIQKAEEKKVLAEQKQGLFSRIVGGAANGIYNFIANGPPSQRNKPAPATASAIPQPNPPVIGGGKISGLLGLNNPATQVPVPVGAAPVQVVGAPGSVVQGGAAGVSPLSPEPGCRPRRNRPVWSWCHPRLRHHRPLQSTSRSECLRTRPRPVLRVVLRVRHRLRQRPRPGLGLRQHQDSTRSGRTNAKTHAHRLRPNVKNLRLCLSYNLHRMSQPLSDTESYSEESSEEVDDVVMFDERAPLRARFAVPPPKPKEQAKPKVEQEPPKKEEPKAEAAKAEAEPKAKAEAAKPEAK